MTGRWSAAGSRNSGPEGSNLKWRKRTALRFAAGSLVLCFARSEPNAR
jgi:hypothetical protein